MNWQRRFLAVGFLMLTANAAHATSFVLIFSDPPGTGFSDPTPVEAVPGNPGTTLGQQRKNLLRTATNIWLSEIASEVPIRIEASVERLSCNSSGGTLAQAGTIGLFANFPGAPLADVSYPQALANAIAREDLDTGNADIRLRINDAVDDSGSGCFTNFDGFYYGSRGTAPDGQLELLSTLLHEVGHGLGFSSFVESSGRFLGDLPGIFDVQAFDTETQRFFDQMTLSQRSIASRNDPFLVWAGESANDAAQDWLDGARAVVVTAPQSAAGSFDAIDAPGTPALGDLPGQIVIVEDDNGRLNDGCDTIVNTAELNGAIAMIKQSSSCNWYDVAFRLQNNNLGVLALLVANNNGNLPAEVGESFTNPPEDFVATVGVGENLFDAVEAASGTATGSITTDSDRLAGTQSDLLRLYAPSGYSTGSSVSHWTLDAKPDLLMEPSKGDIALDQLDITADFMRDLGWQPDAILSTDFEPQN